MEHFVEEDFYPENSNGIFPPAFCHAKMWLRSFFRTPKTPGIIETPFTFHFSFFTFLFHVPGVCQSVSKKPAIDNAGESKLLKQFRRGRNP